MLCGSSQLYLPGATSRRISVKSAAVMTIGESGCLSRRTRITISSGPLSAAAPGT